MGETEVVTEQPLNLFDWPRLIAWVGSPLAAGVGGVDPCDEEPRIRQHVNFRTSVRPHEPRVFADIDLGKAVLLPENARVGKACTIEPGPLATRIHVFPARCSSGA